MQLDELIGKYVEIRDMKSALKKAYTEKAVKIDAVLTKIEGKLLERFAADGTESVRTEFGTAYKTTNHLCSAADKSVFMDFIKNNNEWALLDGRPLKSAVEQYIETHQNVPPGINWTTEVVVNVRRS